MTDKMKLPERLTVVIQPQGWAFEATDSMSLLEAAQQSGIVLPSSCRNGTCRTCMCRLLEGRVKYRIEWPGLSVEEKKEGFILPCVACAETDVVLDVPDATKRVSEPDATTRAPLPRWPGR